MNKMIYIIFEILVLLTLASNSFSKPSDEKLTDSLDHYSGIVFNESDTRSCAGFLYSDEIQDAGDDLSVSNTVLVTAAHCLSEDRKYFKGLELIVPTALIPNVGTSVPFYAANYTEKMFFCQGGRNPDGSCHFGQKVELNPHVLLGTSGKENDYASDIVVLRGDFANLEHREKPYFNSLSDAVIGGRKDFLEKVSSSHLWAPRRLMDRQLSFSMSACPVTGKEVSTSQVDIKEVEELFKVDCRLENGQSGSMILTQQDDGSWGRIGMAIRSLANNLDVGFVVPERRIQHLSRFLLRFYSPVIALYDEELSLAGGGFEPHSFEYFLEFYKHPFGSGDVHALTLSAIESDFKKKELSGVFGPFQKSVDIENVSKLRFRKVDPDTKKASFELLSKEQVELCRSIHSELETLQEYTEDAIKAILISEKIVEITQAKLDEELETGLKTHSDRAHEIIHFKNKFIQLREALNAQSKERQVSFSKALKRENGPQSDFNPVNLLVFEKDKLFDSLQDRNRFKERMALFRDEASSRREILKLCVEIHSSIEKMKYGEIEFSFLTKPRSSENGGGI